MEAYGKADNLRGRYIPGAVGCKRAGIKALRTFLDSGAATALICQDDCLWKPDAATTVARALRELPEDWDLLYFSASSREKNTQHSPHLVRLGGARFCNAILWTVPRGADACLPRQVPLRHRPQRGPAAEPLTDENRGAFPRSGAAQPAPCDRVHP